MDEQRFDGLAKALGAGLTRRRALGGMSGGLLAGLLGWRQTAAARCAKVGQKPKGAKRPCCPGLAEVGGHCVVVPCPFNQVPDPLTGACGCPPGTGLCEGGCGPGGPGAGFCFTHNCPGQFDPQSCSCQCGPGTGGGGLCDPNNNVYVVACCPFSQTTFACQTPEGTLIAGCCDPGATCPPPEVGVCA
jgi:hypothetical protein